VEKKPESLLVVSLGKADGMSLHSSFEWLDTVGSNRWQIDSKT